MQEDYQHQLKIYYMYYRVYEKACDRYKTACVESRETLAGIEGFLRQDIRSLETRQQTARTIAEKYHARLRRSPIHSSYQEHHALRQFLAYLHTGRALTLKECMNLLEEEKRWQQLHHAQERLEKSFDSIRPAEAAEDNWQLPPLLGPGGQPRLQLLSPGEK
jgi:hypothetical protein